MTLAVNRLFCCLRFSVAFDHGEFTLTLPIPVADIGRAISDFTHRLVYDQIECDAMQS